MFENLESLKENYKNLELKIADPDTMKNMENWQKMVKEHADLKPIIEKYNEYVQNKNILEEDKEMLGESLDDDMRDMLKEEVSAREKEITTQEQELKILLLPKDPNDDKNVFIEIRAGAGGY